MQIGVIIICLAILFGVAEIFGRKKHIGRWWTFGLLASNLLYGVIALIVSPSATEKPTAGGKSYKIWGWICIVFGILNLIRINPFALGFFVLGVYLIQLSEGKVINKDPKDYFEQKISTSFKTQGAKPSFNDHFYFLMINGEQSEALTFEELKSKRIKETDLVWRKGLDEWKKANEIEELLSITVPTPPVYNRRNTPPPYKKD